MPQEKHISWRKSISYKEFSLWNEEVSLTWPMDRFILNIMPNVLLAMGLRSNSDEQAFRILMALIILPIALIYGAVKVKQDKKAYRELVASFSVDVPLDLADNSVVLNYGHIELLSELTSPRSESYFQVTAEDWNGRLGEPVATALNTFVRAGLTKRARSREPKTVVTGKGAALVVTHSRDEKARSAARRRL